MATPPYSRFRRVHRRPRRGAAATEYLLILALVVIPIALMMPIFVKTIKLYGTRVTGGLNLPFP